MVLIFLTSTDNLSNSIFAFVVKADPCIDYCVKKEVELLIDPFFKLRSLQNDLFEIIEAIYKLEVWRFHLLIPLYFRFRSHLFFPVNMHIKKVISIIRVLGLWVLRSFLTGTGGSWRIRTWGWVWATTTWIGGGRPTSSRRLWRLWRGKFIWPRSLPPSLLLILC